VTKPLHLSPAKLAHFFFLECERFLRYSATPSARRSADGVPENEERPSAVTEAVLEGGACGRSGFSRAGLGISQTLQRFCVENDEEREFELPAELGAMLRIIRAR
jgi:hypothetical protein